MALQMRKTPDMDEFRVLLKEHGLKFTNQRLAVHEAMMRLGHASADMVTEEIKKAGTARVTVASVYNILSQLALLGVYRHRMSSGSKMFFDVNSYNHIHLYDIRNHEYCDILDDELMGLVESRLNHRRWRGYKVDSIDIQIVCHPTRRRAQGKAQ